MDDKVKKEGMRFTPRPNSSRSTCCVFGCKNSDGKDPTIRYHTFPQANKTFVKYVSKIGIEELLDRRYVWEKVLKLNKNVGPYDKVCSIHFTKDDYFPILPGYELKICKLNQTAVPSLNLSNEVCTPTKTVLASRKNTKKKNAPIKQLSKRRLKLVQKCNEKQDVKVENKESQEHNLELLKKNVQDTTLKIKNEFSNQSPNKNQCQKVRIKSEMFEESDYFPSNGQVCNNIATQTNSDCVTPGIFNFINTVHALRVTTGIKSFQTLNAIVSLVKKVCKNKFENNSTELNTKEIIVMTYMKLKQKLNYNFLAVICNCSSDNECQRMFEEMINILSVSLKSAIHWATKEEISKNFLQNLHGTKDDRIVFDCSEFKIKNPKNLCCQIMTYSQNNFETKKIFNGTSTADDISFVSLVYKGSASNSYEINVNELDVHSTQNKTIDHDYLIKHDKNRWKFLCPPFYKKTEQLSSPDAILTSKITAPRALVEKQIQSFKILESPISVSLVPLLEDIFIVVCATINLNYQDVSDILE